MSKKRLCKLCGKNPAEVPDRERVSETKAVCRPCHIERLRGDMRIIMAIEAKKREERP